MLTTLIPLGENHRSEPLEKARPHRLAQIAAGPRAPRRRGRKGQSWMSGPWASLVLAVVGLALAGLAVGVLAHGFNRNDITKMHQEAAPAGTAALMDVVTADHVYEPGRSSGWHVHPGLHSVVVLSGTLTIYDDACQRQDYGPRQVYLGGRDPHLARNSTAEEVHLVVTYVADSSPPSPGRAVAAPTGCNAA